MPTPAGPGPVISPVRSAADPVRRRPHRWVDAAVGGVFLSLALLVTARLWLDPHTTLVANEQDHAFFQWVLAHGARVVTDGEYPFVTGRMNVPDGVNLMANTSILAFSVPLAGVTAVFGADVSFVVLMTAALAGTAFAWYRVLSRHLVTARSAAAIGAGFCGFAPGIVSQAQGHPNLVAQFLVPFIVWRVMRLAEPGRAVRNGAILGALVTAQAFANEEILLYTALACAAFLLAWAVQHPDRVPASAPTFAAGLGVAALVAGTLLAYPLWVQFFGPQHYRGLLHGYQHGTDLGSFTAFARESLAGRSRVSPASVHFAEETTFLGWPLVILTVAAVAWLRRDAVVRALAATAALFGALSLGARIHLNGRDTGVAGPWALVDGLPLLNAVTPVRFGLVLVPLVGVLLALATDRVLAHPPQARAVWFAALALALVPVLPTPLSTRSHPPLPRFVLDGDWRPYVHEGQTLVPVPLPAHVSTNGMRWAAATHLDFAIPRGYFLAPRDGVDGRSAQFGAPPRPTSTMFERIRTSGVAPAVTDADRAAVVDDLLHWRASLVVLDPHQRHAAALHRTLAELLGPGTQVRDVWIWDVRGLTGATR